MNTTQPIHPICNECTNSNKRSWLQFASRRKGAVMMLVLLVSAAAGFGQTYSGTYNFSGTGGSGTSITYNGSAIANLTVSALTKVGVTDSSSSGNARASGWGTGSTDGGAVGGTRDTGKYFEFTVTAGAGKTISNPTITFGVGRSATGPRQFEWRSSVDSYAAAIPVTANNGSVTVTGGNVIQTPDANSGYTGNTVSLTTSGQTAITFRLYVYGAEAAGGTGGLQGNLSFGGTLNDAVTTYSVTYNGNGSTGGAVPTDGSSPYTSGSTVTVLGNTGSLTRTGFIFAGWNTAANGSGTSYAPGATFAISANTTLYAQWRPVYTVTYNGNGSTGGSVPTDSNTYTNGATVTVLANTGSLTRTGYTFAGWNTAANGSGTDYAATGSATFTMGSANVTLYAKWTINTYTVTYDGNGNTGGTAPVDGSSPYNYNTTVTVLGAGTLTKTGNTFAGWNTAANGSGTSYAVSATFSIAANTTLYAQWTSSPTISGAATASPFTTTYGTVSTAQTFSISGVNLTADITATAPTGFEVSNDGTTYGGTATFTQTGGSASGTLYVRLKGTAVVGGSYNSQNVVLSSTGASSINITTAASGNSVTTKTLTITGLTGSDKVYDKTTAASFTGTPAYSGLTNGDSFSVSGTPTAVFAFFSVSNDVPINVTGYTAPSGNYTVTQPALSGDITPLGLTISGVTVSNKVYDGTATATLLTNGATLATVISGDIVSVTGGGTFANTNVGTGISVTAALTLTGADAGNYTLTQPTGLTGNITIANQTITFAALGDKVSTNPPFALTATASSGLAVSYASDNPAVATVSGNTLTLVGVGTANITASQGGNGNYNPATNVTRTLTVTAPLLAGWEIAGVNSTARPVLAPDNTNDNLIIGGLTLGSGVATTTTGDTWGGNNWDSKTDAAGAIAGGDYVTFSVTAKSGFRVSFAGVPPYNIRRSGTGPTTGIWQYKVGAGAFVDIGSAITWGGSSSSGNLQTAIDLSAVTALQNVPAGTTVTFRIVNWGDTGTGGTWYINDFQTGDDFKITGLVTTNQAPVANNLTMGVSVGGTSTLVIIGGKNPPTDPEGDALTVSSVTQGTSGTVTFSSTSVTYTSTSSASSDSFTYTVSDGVGGTTTATVNVTVSSGGGSFNQISATSIEGGALRFTYLGIPGTNYALEVTHNLSGEVVWSPLKTNPASGTGSIIFTNTPSLAPTNDFYRTRYVP